MSSFRFLTITWTLGILIACSLPVSGTPVQNWLAYDKAVHLLMFLGFSALWMQSMRRPMRTRAVWVLAAGIAFAGFTEIYQGFLPFDRTPSLLDALADTFGTILGIGGFFLQQWVRQKKKATF